MKKVLAFLLLVCILISGCGTTQIISDNARASIYVDGKLKGTGTARITRTGPPQTVNVTARYQGRDVSTTRVSRRFDMVTLVGGLYTYGVGMFFFFRYPSVVMLYTNHTTGFDDEEESIWDQDGESAWE